MRFELDSTSGSPISRFIYGLNFMESERWWGTSIPAGITLNRLGGNRMSAYNWETNDSNCGSDCGTSFQNDRYLLAGVASPGSPGAAVKSRADATFRRGSGMLVTIPMLGYVAADHAGDVTLPSALSVSSPARPDPSRFRVSLPKNPAGATARPDTSDAYVYQDDFAKWLDVTYPTAKTDPERPVFYSLDNEPDLWGTTHKEIRGQPPGRGEVVTGYDELVTRSIAYASAVKDVVPEAKVFGPALGIWNGFVNLMHNTAPDPAGARFCAEHGHGGRCTFLDYYLSKFRQAERQQGRRLLDVLDVHWYTQVAASGNWVTNDYAKQDEAMIQARVQAPRSLWDPSYVENSWVARAVPGCLSPGGCAIQLLPRLARSIATHAPGTRIAITEYYYGRGGDISGAIAQADALGVFGREGVFAAALWPSAGVWAHEADGRPCVGDVECATRAYACIFAAYRAYLDFDGKGSRFGNHSIASITSDASRTSVYASMDAGAPDRLVVVAINKTPSPLKAGLVLRHSRRFGRAEVYRITGEIGSCSGPTRVKPDLPITLQNAFATVLPGRSVSVLVLSP